MKLHCRTSKGDNSKNYELLFLCSARHLMMLYSSMKFNENILNSFQVIEWTQNYNCRISKGE